jgi:two-component system chemotaxis response regulator CheB
MSQTPIRVLVVDDSAVVRAILREGLNADPFIRVVGTARDAYEARDMIVELAPQVMTLDVEMPRMDGVDFLQRLMPQYPIPVVMVSSHTERGRETTLSALAAGAVDFVTKPSRNMSQGVEQMMLELRTKIKIASTANVAHWKNRRPQAAPLSPIRVDSDRLIAIGASTGGTDAIRTVLERLPTSSPGVLIVQHMPPGFTATFAALLNQSTSFLVKEAAEGDLLTPGTALVAPGGRQCAVELVGEAFTVHILGEQRVNGHAPSVDVMMRSVARAAGRKAVGVLLTGMGADGARGLLEMRRAGAATIAQDEATSVVYGMPREAAELGAATFISPLEMIADTIGDCIRSRSNATEALRAAAQAG